jgi:hypothetical protein
MTRPGIMSERLIALFLLGLVAFCSPFLAIFDRPETLFGIPLLYLFLFAAWLGLVAMTALAAESGVPGGGAAGTPSRPEGEPGAEEEG